MGRQYLRQAAPKRGLIEALNSVKELLQKRNNGEAISELEQIIKIETENTENKEQELTALRTKRKRLWRFRFFLVFVFGGIALIILLLGWKAYTPTEIEADITVDEFSVELSDVLDIYSVNAARIDLNHSSSLTFYPDLVEEAVFDLESEAIIGWRKLEVKDSLKLSPLTNYWSASFESNYLSLGELSIGPGSKIKFSHSVLGKNTIELRIKKGHTSGIIDVGEQFILTCNNCQLEVDGYMDTNGHSRKFKISTQLREVPFLDIEKTININIELMEGSSASKAFGINKRINIRDVDFITRIGEAEESTILETSTIYFNELDRKKFALSSGDFLKLRELQNFQIKRLKLSDHFYLTLYGDVGKLESGTENYMYSRMPSWLEWLYMNHFLKLLFASMVAIFSTVISIFKQFKINEEIFDDGTST